MTRLYLIRHGNTADEETGRVYKGSLDIPLSEEGIRRMEKAAVFLSTYKLDKVYTSTLSRSMVSGAAIAGPQRLRIEPDAALNEIHFGLWEGLSFTQIQERYPDELARWLKDPGAHPPPEGESFRAARKRTMAKIAKIIREDAGKNIAVVAHGAVLRVMIFSLLGMRLSRLFRIGQDYGCINIVDVFEDGHVMLNLLNYTQY